MNRHEAALQTCLEEALALVERLGLAVEDAALLISLVESAAYNARMVGRDQAYREQMESRGA